MSPRSESGLGSQGSDGIKLMESLPELADLPVIFISGYRRDETIAQALKAGAPKQSVT